MLRALALYGSLMTGLGGQRAAGVDGALARVGPCLIPGTLYDLGRYPGLRPGAGAVEGELHEVRDAGALARLDAFEGFEPSHPSASLFVRRRLRLLRPARDAWVYVYNGPVAPERRIASGSWRRHRGARPPGDGERKG